MATPSRLTRAELSTWVRFMFGARSLFNALDRRLRDECGLSMEDFDVLAAIQRSRQVRMNDLAGDLSYSPSRLSHVIQRMEDRGWVERKPAPDDKRAKTLTLTAGGRDILDDAWPRHADAIRELFLTQLDEEERQAIEAAFSRIRAATRP